MKCVVSKHDFATLEKSRPGFMAGLTSVVNASLYTLSKFLEASATAHELFSLVEEGGAMSKGRKHTMHRHLFFGKLKSYSTRLLIIRATRAQKA